MRTNTLLLIGGAAAVGYYLMKVTNAVQQLRVSVKSLHHKSSDITSSKFLLTLSVYNPNDVSINFERVYAQIKIEGNLLGEIDVNGAGQKIAPVTTTDLEIPLIVDHFSALTTIMAIIQKLIARQPFTTPFDVQGTLYAAGLQLPISSKVTLADFGIKGIAGIGGIEKRPRYASDEKVLWINGSYPFYTIAYSFKDNGVFYYMLRTPSRSQAGGRVREDELRPNGSVSGITGCVQCL